MRIYPKAITAICLITLLASQKSTTQAQEITPQEQVDQVLQSLCQYYSQKTSFSVEVAKQTITQSAGIKNVRNETVICSLTRPNRLSIVLKQGQADSFIFADGQTITSYLPTYHQYRQEKSPESFDLAFEQHQELGAQLLFNIPLIQTLITTKPYQILKRDIDSPEYLGTEIINGIDCHQLRVNTYPFRIKFWVQQGDQPRLIKIASDLEAKYQDPRGQGDSVQLTWEFKNWKFNHELPAKVFAFSPPASAKKVTSFSLPQKKGDHPLIGKKAPDFSMELLGGGKADLASHLGKHVVVLDFWATWCGPCVKGLPILTKVTDTFKNKDVIFYAVNQRENPEQIKAFLEKMKLNISVPLDKSAQVGKLYGVSGIPQTVVIDKKGIVRNVQVGVLPNLEKQFAEELTHLLSEKIETKSQIDLTCKSVLFLPEKIRVGDPVILKFVAGNLGIQQSQAGTHNISLSINDQMAYAGPVDVAINAKGDATFLVPQDFWYAEFTKAGQYNYKLKIDSDGHIKETNEENNTCLGQIEVTAIN